jgi:hypothetical protein
MSPTDSSISSWPEPAPCRQIRAALSELGVAEVSAIAAIPRAPRYGTSNGRRYPVLLRYPLVATEEAGTEALFLRSHGADFNLIPPEWLSRDLSRVFSIGPGIDPDTQAESLLVLVQCFEPDRHHHGLPALLTSLAASVTSSDSTEYGRDCLRVSALFAEVRYPFSFADGWQGA